MTAQERHTLDCEYRADAEQRREALEVKKVEIALADALESGALTPRAYREGVNAFDAALLKTRPGSVRREELIAGWLVKLEEYTTVRQYVAIEVTQ